jgi:hypothetical protein
MSKTLYTKTSIFYSACGLPWWDSRSWVGYVGYKQIGGLINTMPFIETPDELAEHIADLLGIYGIHQESEANNCRQCFVGDLVARIKASVSNEKELEGK